MITNIFPVRIKQERALLEILRKIAFLNKKNELRPLHILNKGLKK